MPRRKERAYVLTSSTNAIPSCATLIEAAKKAKAEGEELAIMIPPSGTRKKTDRWKSGFYHIARGAEIPVIPAYLDSKTRTYGYGDPIYMDSGSVKRDMERQR